jgi:hypothetical protein
MGLNTDWNFAEPIVELFIVMESGSEQSTAAAVGWVGAVLRCSFMPVFGILSKHVQMEANLNYRYCTYFTLTLSYPIAYKN